MSYAVDFVPTLRVGMQPGRSASALIRETFVSIRGKKMKTLIS